MGSHGIKDQVAIVGMGCTKFGEHWDKGVDELLLWSTTEALDTVGLAKDDVDAFWLGTAMGTGGGQALARPLGKTRRTRSRAAPTTWRWPWVSRR